MNELPELLDHYFSLGVAEGKEGRNHDTKDGEAQATRDLIDQKIMRLRRESAEARKAAFIEAAEMASLSSSPSVYAFAAMIRAKAEETRT